MKHGRVLALAGSVISLLLLAAPAFAALPPGRGLEQVSPNQKNGGDAGITNSIGLAGEEKPTFAAPAGDRVAYQSYGSFAGAPSGFINQYLAERTASGWINKPLIPTPEVPNFPSFSQGFYGFTCETCDRVYGQIPWGGEAGDENEVEDIYTTDGDLTWTRESVGELPNPTGGENPVMSAEGGVLGFNSTSPLTTSATVTVGGAKIAYIRSNGVTTPVAQQPNGELLNTGGSFIGNAESLRHRNAIGPDGSPVYFESPLSGGLKHVYARLATGEIVQIDESQCTGSCTAQTLPALWVGATKDGDTAYFVTDQQLLDSHPTSSGVGTLYSYKLSSGELIAIADKPGLIGGGLPLLGFWWASDDGSRVYFTSRDVLTSEPNAAGATAEVGGGTVNNTYLLEYDAAHPEGRIAFVGRGFGENLDNVPVLGASPSGRFALIQTAGRLSPEYEGGTVQVYLYDAVTGQAECLSCVSPPVGIKDSSLRPFGPTEEGAVLFATPQAVDPKDTNQQDDVYLHEGGIGGQSYLLSGGQSEAFSEPVGLSEDGTDAFFTTYARLLKSDTDGYKDIYDARVGGGFPEPLEPGECEGDGCSGPLPGTPALVTPATSTLVGPPNPKAKHKQKQKQQKKKKKKNKKKAKQGKNNEKRHARQHQIHRAGRVDG